MARHNSPYGALGASQPYAFYGFQRDREIFHLHCPKCGEEELEIVEELAERGDHRLLGDIMRCWICKHEFAVTENCWRMVMGARGWK